MHHDMMVEFVNTTSVVKMMAQACTCCEFVNKTIKVELKDLVWFVDLSIKPVTLVG